MSSFEIVLPPVAAVDGRRNASRPMPMPFGVAAGWRHYSRIERRVVGQLLQTLLYENVLPYEAVAEPALGDAEATRFVLTLGERRYRVAGWQCHSFQLIRLDHATLEVEGVLESAVSPTPVSLPRFLEDLQVTLGGGRFSPASSTS